MARKKTKQVAKAKKGMLIQGSAKNNGLMLIKIMEKEFKEMPAVLVKQYRHYAALLKEQEKKLKSDIQKAEIQKKTAQDKCDMLAKKSTISAKNKLILIKKDYNDKNKIILNLAAELEEIKKYGKMLMQNQARFVASSKQLFKLEQPIAKAKIEQKTVAPAKTRKKSTSRGHIVDNAPIETPVHSVDMPETTQPVEETAELI